MALRALMSSSEVRKTRFSILALFQCGERRTIVIQDHVALPTPGSCAGHRVAGLMTTFLIDLIPVLGSSALMEVQITISECLGTHISDGAAGLDLGGQ